jgi:hypothetical protein
MTPRGWNSDKDLDTIRVATRDLDTNALYVLDRRQNNAPQRRDPDLLQDNIVTSRRRR